MLFLAIGSAKKVFEEAYGKLHIFNQSNFDQYVNTTWAVANTLVDLFRIIGGRK